MKFIPKKYAALLSEVYKDSEGYWAYAKTGYQFAGMGCHTAHEDTQKDLLAMIRTIEPCNCKECEESLVMAFDEYMKKRHGHTNFAGGKLV